MIDLITALKGKRMTECQKKQATALWWKKWHEQEDTFIHAERKWAEGMKKELE